MGSVPFTPPTQEQMGVLGHPTGLTAGAPACLCHLAILLRFCLRGDYDRDMEGIVGRA